MMAGAVLTQSERELARIGDKNFIAMKTAKGQLKEALLLNADLRAKMARMQKSIDTLTDQRTTAEGQIKRLLDLLERTQAQRDAAQAELNKALAVANAARRLVDNYDKDCGVCRQQFLKELIAALAAFDAQREAKP